MRVVDCLLRAQTALGQGLALAAWLQQERDRYRIINGYGRPVADKDERVAPLLREAKAVGLDQGAYVRLAIEIEALLQRDKPHLRLNIAGLYGALAADFGFSAREFGLFMQSCFMTGMPPCFLDASNKPEGSLFPLRCERIAYTGPKRRAWHHGGSLDERNFDEG